MRAFQLVALALLVLLAPSGPASAQVVIDPDSPSAKEYAIPLEDERRQADPGRAPDAGITQGDRSSPLFGEGIEDTQGTPGRGGRTEGSDAGAAKGDRQGSAGASTAGTPDVVRAATTNPGAPDGGLGTPVVIGGVALAVLLLGGVAGVFVRRRA